MKVSKTREKFGKGEEIGLQLHEMMPSVDVSDSIEDMFRNEQSANQHEVKELFSEGKVKSRTDLSSRQIKLITKALYLGKLTGMKEINQLLSDFMTLRISDSRQSRKEYVEGLKAKMDNAISNNMLNVRGQFGK